MRQSVLVRVNPNEDERRRKAMMMIPVSEALKELLCRQGMSTGTVAAVEGAGMDAGLPKGDRTDPLADAAAGGPRIRSGMEKNRESVTPAKFTVLTCNGASAHGRRKQATSAHLRLAWSQ